MVWSSFHVSSFIFRATALLNYGLYDLIVNADLIDSAGRNTGYHTVKRLIFLILCTVTSIHSIPCRGLKDDAMQGCYDVCHVIFYLSYPRTRSFDRVLCRVKSQSISTSNLTFVLWLGLCVEIAAEIWYWVGIMKLLLYLGLVVHTPYILEG